MYSPSTRLLTVLELLQSRAEISGAELAERLEVDVRTVRRYITMLRDMGIPVETERGRYGFYSMRPGFRLPPMMFNDDEILAVILGLMAVRKLGMAGTVGVESAASKIQRVLPNELRERVRAVEGTLTLSMNPFLPTTSDLLSRPTPNTEPAAASLLEVVALLTEAAYDRRCAWIAYRSGQDADTTRTIDTYGLVYHAGYWYTAAYCHLRRDLRSFRLDRVRDIKLLDDTFQRPAEFDALNFVLTSMANTPGTWFIEVLLQTTLDIARELIPPQFATLEVVEGGVMMRCHVQDLQWLARVLATLSYPFQIQNPPELRDVLRQHAQTILERV